MTELNSEQKFADYFCDALVELGYTHCFFVAGGNIMHLLDAARTRFSCVPVVHEVSAGIAAEYFNESDGNGRAFALVTAGPGLTNIVTAVAGAWLESRELLVVGGQVKTTDLRDNTLRQRGIQEIDGVAILQPITKISKRIDYTWNQEEILEAINIGRTLRPGPVFLEIPLDVQASLKSTPNEQIHARRVSLKNGDLDLDEHLSAIKKKLHESQRPLILIGGGVSRRVTRTLQEKIKNFGIPMMTTWNGADRLDSRWPNYFGRPNTWGQRHANLLVAQADLVIALGTRLGLQQTGFNWKEWASNAHKIQVDIDAAELAKGHPQIDDAICFDAGRILEKILEIKTLDYSHWISYCREVTNLLPLNDPNNETRPGYISPYVFFLELSELLREDDLVIPCSSGGANSTALQTIQQKFGQVFITDKGLASMGYGLAGAIGAAIAHRGRRTVLIEGDGGFSQNLQELATVSVNALPLKMFIFANEGYASIRTTQKNYFGGSYLGCDTSTGLGFPDWQQLFGSYGIQLQQLEKDWVSDSEFLRTFQSDSPMAYIVPIDPLQTYWPKISSRVLEDGGMESEPLHRMSPDLQPELLARVAKYL